MEYKEVTKKSGGIVVFTNFEELLKELFEVQDIKEIPEDKKSGNHYICHCPFCKQEGHRKHKLYIKDDLTVGTCFVCNRAYINQSEEAWMEVEVPEFSGLNKYLNPDYGELDVVTLTNPIWSLDKFNYELDDQDIRGIEYLKSRHKFLPELASILDFKYLDGNVVIPFRYKGDIFYYQIRFIGGSRIKYFFPPISAKPPYIIEHGRNKKFIIVEGVFDAIACLIMAPEYTPFAILGSTISDYQLRFLREYVPEKILIWLDETKLSIGVKQKVVSKIDYCPISIMPSNGQDPEERLKYLLKTGKNLQWITD